MTGRAEEVATAAGMARPPGAIDHRLAMAGGFAVIVTSPVTPSRSAV
jgi:hypothetical protein